MFGIGFTEALAIGVIALIVIGPKQLPEVARVLAGLMKELKKATQELSGGLLEVTRDVQNSVEETKNQIFQEGQKWVDSLDEKPNPENQAGSSEENHPTDELTESPQGEENKEKK